MILPVSLPLRRTCRRARSQALPAVVAVVAAVLLGSLLPVWSSAPASASAISESSGRPDPGLGREGCRLMDRVFVRGGCSRTQCRQAGEQIRYSPNAETCTIGGRTGTSYGSEIDSRTCARLHRRWVAAVNFCAANPHRDQSLILGAPQCLRPFTTYVTASRVGGGRATRAEAEGRYDVCLRPGEARRLEREAARTGQSLRRVVARRVVPPAAPPASVLVVGDSLTWRGTDELARLRPDWDIDGASGRNLGELGDRVRRVVAERGLPTGLVIALGTNPARRYGLDDLRAVVSRLPATTPVMVMLPYRRVSASNTRQQVAGVERAAEMLQQLAATRPDTCVADWPSLVRGRPSMLVDGTHQTRAVEETWARFVSGGWDACPAS